MSSTTNMNIVLGQGSAIKEVHNVKKQNLEVNQQCVVQQVEDKKEEDKNRVQDFEKSKGINMEKKKKKIKVKKINKRGSEEEKQKEKNNFIQRNIIDITV